MLHFHYCQLEKVDIPIHMWYSMEVPVPNYLRAEKEIS